MNVNEVQTYLKETYGDNIVSEIGHSIFYREFDNVATFENCGDKGYGIGSGIEDSRYSFIIVDGYGGEGEGDSYWSVAKITDKNTNESIFVRVDGYYASYVGAECDDPSDWREVKQVTETRVVYK